MKWFSGSHYFLDLFINPTIYTISNLGVHIYVNGSSVSVSSICNENVVRWQKI